MESIRDIQRDLFALKNSKKADLARRFFKCGKGQYGEGDIFLGILVPEQRSIVKRYFQEVDLDDVRELVKSQFHELRLTGLLLWVYRFEKGDVKEQDYIYHLYIENKNSINNWDLVDTTTPNIVGSYLWNHPKERKLLDQFANSENLWERRMSILATFFFIKRGYFHASLKIATHLLNDKEDLIHKSVGWMLREIGKRDQEVLECFLREKAILMPRTMLRYAIEKFDTPTRKKYLAIKKVL